MGSKDKKMFYNYFCLNVSDSNNLYGELREISRMIKNFDDCLNAKGNLPAGTRWFDVDETIKPCTVRKVGNMTVTALDGLYTVKGYGGYKPGIGCFYETINKNSKKGKE